MSRVGWWTVAVALVALGLLTGCGKKEVREEAVLVPLDLGIDAGRFEVTSYGEEVPLDPGHDEAAWAQNRRAEFVEMQD